MSIVHSKEQVICKYKTYNTNVQTLKMSYHTFLNVNMASLIHPHFLKKIIKIYERINSIVKTISLENSISS